MIYVRLSYLFVFGVLCIGCSSPFQSPGAYQAHLETTEDALQALSNELEWNEKDSLLLYQEKGYIHYQRREYSDALKSFDKAILLRDQYQERPAFALHKIRDAGFASVTNLRAFAYTGSPVEDIQVRTYRALIYLEQGDIVSARVESFAAYSMQKKAAAYYKKEIEERVTAVQKKGIHIDEILDDTQNNEDIKRLYRDRPELEQYKDFVNPFSVMVNTLVFLIGNLEQQDLDRAQKNIQRLKDMNIAESVLNPLQTYLKQLRSGAVHRDPLIIVLFENAHAPHLVEKKLTLALPLKGFTVLSVALASMQYDTFSEYDVTWGASQTSLLCSFNDIRSAEFKARLPGLIAKTVLISLIKATLQYEISRATENNIAAVLLSTLYTISTTKADTRIWQSLPAEYRIGVSSRNDSGTITLKGLKKEIKITIPKAECVLVRVRDWGTTVTHSVHILK